MICVSVAQNSNINTYVNQRDIFLDKDPCGTTDWNPQQLLWFSFIPAISDTLDNFE